jgi:predicted transcriptional regulator
MQKLTRAEEDLMLILWRLERSFLKDLVAEYEEPRPNVSTVATLLRILERKGFVAHRAYSKVFEYYPLVQRRAYLRVFFADFLNKYFSGDVEDLLSFVSIEVGKELRIPSEERPASKPEAEREIDKTQLSLF